MSSNGLTKISELIEIFHLKKAFSEGSSELVSLTCTVAKSEMPDLRGTKKTLNSLPTPSDLVIAENEKNAVKFKGKKHSHYCCLKLHLFRKNWLHDGCIRRRKEIPS
ncbi:hypothetical protein PJI16_19390 [Nitrospira sp. MA-1]|nr:hypothetical protein [Nitrospira sp. MA-1]